MALIPKSNTCVLLKYIYHKTLRFYNTKRSSVQTPEDPHCQCLNLFRLTGNIYSGHQLYFLKKSLKNLNIVRDTYAST